MKKNRLNRRNFLKTSTIGMLGAGIATTSGWGQTAEKEADLPLKIKEHRILGRTCFKVSDLGMGYIQDESLISAALDAGMNYIDSAESYPGHHKAISQVLKGRDRKSLFITSKMQVQEDRSKEGFLKRARKALEELNTEYLDCMMMHMPEKVETLKTPGFHEAMQQLKTEGRIKFLGVSHHGSFWFKAPEESMEKVLLAAAEDSRFDVFLLAYNFLQIDQGSRVLQVCKEKKIGTTLMKTMPVSKYYIIKSRIEKLEKEKKEIHPLYLEGVKRYKEMVKKGEPFIQKYNLKNPKEIKAAAVRFVLNNPNVNTVCGSMKTFEDLDWFLRLSGAKLRDLDKTKLSAYKEACGQLYCRHACGLCEPQCPDGVPVNTIMRYNHYFEAQGREKEAMLKYAAIPGANADLCRTCVGHCEPACPYGVPVQGMLIAAHDLLSAA